MSSVVINHRFGLPETIKKLIFPVTVEEEMTIVIKSNKKRKREDCDEREQECKYIRLERRLRRNLVKKFRLPEDADGVMTVTVEKVRPQPPKPKTLQIVIS
ncbi:hypothetical protein DY000_02059602 [Brassica cretica]|uniref:SHSP domain-containing protein n=1 Tax=Brassica cretica TaxID=69181 RepID=A0ABQ7ARY3_BRACR|nr:hypothetical protein DY000_02059602 [Brassica cretica]